jgi:anti-sigma regulatory factor (Ser/Thr protein kinase)
MTAPRAPRSTYGDLAGGGLACAGMSDRGMSDRGMSGGDISGGTAPVGLLPERPSASSGGRDRMWEEAACALRGRPESVRLARDFARETLTAWGLTDLSDDIVAVISELATNALNHGLRHYACTKWARPIRVRLISRADHVLCTVSDPGEGAPVRTEPDYFRECGRGLHVVEACSDMWGWNPVDSGGKVIWAVFRVAG